MASIPARFLIHSQMTVTAPTTTVGVKPNGQPLVHQHGKDKEFEQYCVEWKKFPIPESYFRKAFHDLCETQLKIARSAGLIRDVPRGTFTGIDPYSGENG